MGVSHGLGTDRLKSQKALSAEILRAGQPTKHRDAQTARKKV